MKKFFLGLRIRIKLLAAFGSILFLSILLIVFSAQSIKRIIHYKTINEEVDVLKLRMESLDLACREFIYEGYKSKSFLEEHKTSSIDSFNINLERSKTALAIIEHFQIDATQKISNRESLKPRMDTLQADFQELIKLLQTRGFKDFGLEGTLRAAIHKVENSGYEFDKVTMLMLRRHEKDFFLRKDLKYQDEFNKRFDGFYQQLQSTGEQELLSALNIYKEEFNKVVAIEKQIGLTEKDGIRGQLKNNFARIRPEIETMRALTKEQNQAQINNTQWILWIIFSIQIIAGVAMALIYSGLLTKSIKEIRGGIQKLAAGVFPNKLPIHTTEEIGQTKIAFNQFIDRLKAATSFAEQLGSGALNTKYDEDFANDILAKSLLNAQLKLSESEERQKKINWLNEGAARFNDILKNDSEDIKTLGDQVIRLLINYLGANQGALYIVVGEKSNQEIQRLSTYAYEKKKFVDERLNVGSGLVGQCVLEGETIYMTAVPKDFIKITSGLGQATPRNIIIVPLKVRDQVMGVVELASFQLFESHQIEFVERMGENIASLIANKKATVETSNLLKESQLKERSLKQKEEEMRQNTEELQATQEEMKRQRLSMQNEIELLKEKLAELIPLEQ